MWSDIPAILKALTIAVPLILAVMRFLRPGRLIGLLSAAVERETFRQMVEHERTASQWWQQRATECQEQLTQCGRD